jgi:hypothetical protein
MKTLKSQEAIEKAQALQQAIQYRKAMEKNEKELKDWFMTALAGENSAKVGDILIVITDAQTTTIDRKALAVDQGDEFVAAYTKVTPYRKLEVKKA